MAVSSERELIESLREWLRVAALEGKHARGVRLGIGDDCAILRPPEGHEIVVTTDFSLETVHFRRDWHTPESAGHRCLARGLSDLAAMGATPLAAFLSLALPAELLASRAGRPSWRDRFFNGLLALARAHNVPLAGGDTAQSPLILQIPHGAKHRTKRPRSTGLALADIVVVGSAPRNRALLRSTARAGDHIYVTGQLGGAAAELAQLSAHPRRFRQFIVREETMPNPHPHLFPQPRLAVGAWLLRNKKASSAIDVSDGLSTDLDHLCEESGLAATLDEDAIPIHPLAKETDNPLRLALHGGEDYELLFTASPGLRLPRRIAGVPVTCIGTMQAQRAGAPRMVLHSEIRGKLSERMLAPAGWEHYR